jgi:two-component system, cell cycle sensor histidine kinase and response regulator CckA
VAGFAEFVSRDPGLAPRAREDLLQLRSAVDRMAGLTRQLLAFSRQQVLTPETLDLNAAVSEVKPMLERLIGRNVTMTVSLAPARLWVGVDRSQLTQVLLNLAINARDAMPDGGEVRMLTGIRSIDGNWGPGSNGALAPGGYAELVVRDTGMGIPPEHLPRTFEPFFTTKAVGQGTGLSLATVHGIVSQSGGQVAAVSDAGGAAFTVLLPLTDAPGPATVRSGAHGGHAGDVRPGAARELSSRRPELPVVWISGHPWEPAQGDAPRQPAQPVLQKPVAAAALRDAVAGRCIGHGAARLAAAPRRAIRCGR